ncbi:ABC transporter permease [Mesorhizobium sp. KR9-304]|uniref:ABC transporter permease n=1 Tax=Mesorhizobium sp. KR9-304 TaxID=3156614 RepID=UPI0032B3AC76
MNPLPIVMALFRRNRATVLLFVCLVTIAVALGIAVSAQERALRQGSARAADRFDLIVGAPGSQTELLMNIVYLQPSAIELLKPEVLARLLAEPKTDLVAPIGYGDSVDGFSVVGTTAEFVAHLSGALGEGRLFETETEAVVGAASPFRLGQTIEPVHGHGEGGLGALEGGDHDEHDGVTHHVDLTIVGRMAATGTPWDAAIIVPVEQVWHVHGLPTGHPPGEERIGPPFDPAHLPGVPAVVVKPDTVAAAYGLRSAYRTQDSTAFFPAEVLVQLYAVLGDVRSVLDVMALTTRLLVVAAIMAGLMALIQLQRERFAVLRALGAPRAYIFLVVWTGITAMVAAGAILGLGLGYAVAQVLSAAISQQSGIAISASIGRSELILAGVLVLLGGLVALAPAALVHNRSVVDVLRG